MESIKIATEVELNHIEASILDFYFTLYWTKFNFFVQFLDQQSNENKQEFAGRDICDDIIGFSQFSV